MKGLLLAGLSLAAALGASLSPVGRARVSVFDLKAKAFVGQEAVVLYQAEPEVLQLQLPGFQPGQPLNARVDVQGLPHYQAWVDKRRAEGGLAWKALEALLGELKGRPAAILTLGPLPSQGPAELRVGLMDGHQFELYGRIRGTVASSRRGLVFEAQDLVLDKASARAAWSVMAPLARSQASRMAGQR